MFCRGVAEEAAGKSQTSSSKEGRGWLHWGLRWVRSKNGANTNTDEDNAEQEQQEGEEAEKEDDEPFTKEQVLPSPAAYPPCCFHIACCVIDS
jgi:hypothetical protein